MAAPKKKKSTPSNRRSSTQRTLKTKIPGKFQGKTSLMLLVFILGFGAVGSYLLVFSRAAACTLTVPRTVSTIDGQGNYLQLRPGNVICIPGGSRGALELRNLRGTATSPITIRNSGSPVTINITNGTGAIVIKNSSYVKVSGTGVSENCGSKFAAAAQQCGFVLSGAGRGISATSNVDYIETDHIEIKNTGAAAIKFHGQDNPDLVITGINIHHNYIHDINVVGSASEGMYIGANRPPNDPAADNYNIEDVDIGYNLVERTAWDGINVKQGIRNVKVHHNIVNNAGLLKLSAQSSGIALREVSNAEIYNNFVYGSGQNNIKSGDQRGVVNNKYYNNIVVSSGDNGFEMDDNELDAKIYNNTVVNSKGSGVKLPSNGTTQKAYDNIVVGSVAPAFDGATSGVSNNLIGSLTLARFVDPTNRNYKLSSTSPAINAGRNTGLFPLFDYDNNTRPKGTKTDQGAFESF